jgi:indolepyruvate decarboxylase
MSDQKEDDGLNLTRRRFMQFTGALAMTAATKTAAATSAIPVNASSIPEKSHQPNTNVGNMTCIQYVLSRLKELGVKHTFGVPGDFVYDVCDAVQDDPDIKGIWCANELNAGYAADGYARTNGVGVSVLTMGAELSAFQSLATANAELSKVVQITSMPSDAEVASGARLHHMIAGMAPGRQDLWAEMVKPLTAGGDGGAIMTPENCVYETERLIAAMLYHSKPISMVFPRLNAHMPVVWPQGKLEIPLANPQSDPEALDSAVREILYRLGKANKAIWLPGYVTRRFDCVAESQALIEASGLPFCTGFQDKAVISEQHPQFVGVYLGGWKGMADPKVTQFVESCDCWVGIGPENHTFNNGFHTMQYTLEDTVNIMPHETRVGSVMYKKVEMKDILIELTSKIKKRTDVKGPEYNGTIAKKFTGNAGDEVTYDTLYQRFQAFLKPNDILVGATSLTSLCGTTPMEMPDGVDMEAQGSFGMLGWDTAAALGNGAAAPDRRCVILSGEGGHQMTANELGTYARYGIKPVFVVVNNGGYMAERVTNRYPDEGYNDLAQWDYSELPRVMGCKDWFTAKATTVGELDAAMAEASNATTGVYIEVVIDKDLVPDCADFLFGLTGGLWGMAGRTWEQWLEEGRNIKRS